MKQIPLTQGKFTLVDDEDFEELSKHKWYALKGGATFYVVRNTNKYPNQDKISMHRIIKNASKDQNVDHKDSNGLNNQRWNLRFCTNSRNQMNRKKQKNCSSIFKGVNWCKQDKKWRARIQLNKKRISLGSFSNEAIAAKIYDKAAKRLFGEFAKLNF